MQYQKIFKRYELKYMITRQQKALLLEAMKPYMTLDKYGHTTIRNIYYDTDNYMLIRHSIEKPVYKEKLRVRSYGAVRSDEPVFVELKKKYKHVVYKRRITVCEQEAEHWLCGITSAPTDTQIAREIDYFCNFYTTLRPRVFLSYEREAFHPLDSSDFRVTFDENILARTHDLSLTSEVGGTPVLDRDHILMELKTVGGIPLWMTHLLTQNKIYKTSFSKYGTVYKNMIHTKTEGEPNYV